MTEINKSSQQNIKESNMRMVFGLIHKNEIISRADIKKITSLSATTVSSLVEELMQEGFVVECGMKQTSKSGRKAVMLRINSDGGFFLGMDVRKNAVIANLCGLDFEVKESIKLPIEEGQAMVMVMLHAIGRLTRGRKILGITIGIPGVIDPKTNSVISSTILDEDDANDMYLLLKQAMPNVNIYIKNNSGLVALCEKEFGCHNEINNLVSVDIDDGVGAGVLIDGAIYDGNGFAGEFGHMSVDFNGSRCSCGNYGCLELYASIPRILDRTKTNSLEELRNKIDDKDKKVLSDLQLICRAIAFGINNIVNLIDPELIVIGGSAPLLGETFLDMIREYFEQISLIKNKNIVFSNLTVNPVALGAVRYAFNMTFGQ